MYDRTTDETDTDERISALFRHSTVEIEPDVAGLVRGGIDRGRVKRRRSNLGMVLAAAATVSVVGVTATVVSTLDSGGAGLDPTGASAAAPATSTVARPTATKPTTEPGRPPSIPTADIPVKAADLPRSFAELFPGKITPAEARTGRIMDDGRAGQYAHFRWNGFTTTVAFVAFAGTPAQECRQSGRPPANCVTRPDGSVLSTERDTAPARDGGGSSQGATLFTTHGYQIFVMSYNTGLKEGPILADEPPFSIAQLVRAVTSNVWF